ncbi:unnamed protein product [Clonostachys rosea f. rosea IK726]|uniref:Uncharacterized protein n=1 Tax=Clonostachys rosea f. rosea IK726 TaxID=1349383 RepID=A0ACA9U321_BIOOC|nr:unnamed protein product [Clonostachys rosea f. rosea IK726]
MLGTYSPKGMRLSYTSAVQCLLKKPATTPKSDMPGVTNRFEDFFGTHIAQTEDVSFRVPKAGEGVVPSRATKTW